MKLDGTELVGLLIATSFAAGLNAYAPSRRWDCWHMGHIIAAAGLQLLSSWWVIGASAVLFSIEFFADKIPAFDLLWNAAHTFVRVPVAALIAYRATSQLSPEKQLLATLVGGAIALAAHGGKTAARAAVNLLRSRFRTSRSAWEKMWWPFFWFGLPASIRWGRQ